MINIYMLRREQVTIGEFVTRSEFSVSLGFLKLFVVLVLMEIGSG